MQEVLYHNYGWKYWFGALRLTQSAVLRADINTECM